MLGITIRSEDPADAAAIEAVTVAVLATAPHAAHTEQVIVAALRQAGALTVSLVTECGREIVGHVAESPVMLSDGSVCWFGLGPLSLLPFGQSLPSAVVTFHPASGARTRASRRPRDTATNCLARRRVGC